MNIAIAIIIGMLCGLACYVLGWLRGHSVGRDIQRVADIQEQWAREDRRRDKITGRFCKYNASISSANPAGEPRPPANP